MISSALMGVVLVGAMNCVGSVIRGRLGIGDTGNAEQLANQLVAEILAEAYLEPDDAPVFGRESSESGGARTYWDDADDYHLWSASPPQNRTGTVLPKLEGWQRDVVVEWVDPANVASAVGTDRGLKRITVTVRHNGRILAVKTALRSDKYTEGGP